MNTDLLKQLALRSAGGAAGGAALGGYVAPEGSRLEGAGVGALAGGLAGAGSVALGHGTPHVPAEELAEAAHVLETAPFHAVAPGGVKMPPVERLRGTPRAPREPSTSPQGAFYTEAPEHADVYRADVEDAADHFGGLLSQQITGLPRRKTAAYLAGQHAAAATLGLEKEAWAPLIAAGARMAPTLLRAGRSLMGGNMGNAAKGVQAAARGGWNTFAKQAPRTAAGLQTAGRVAANPVVQTGAMIAAS